MPARARIVGLYCGQGMSHLIEIYVNGVVKAVADFLILIDFGGDEKYSEDAVNYVYTKLKAQSDSGRNAKFDLTIISHQDKDHLILLGPLGDKITAEGLVIQFGKVFLGGVAWDAKNKKTVNDFFGISKTRPAYNWSETQRSDYYNVKSRPKLGKLDEFGGFAFRVLISQLAIPKGSRPDFVRNASSTVVVIENGTETVILPGDATYQTMNYVNELYKAWGGNKLIPMVRALEVPHHGAMRSAAENYVASKTSDQLVMTIVNQFSKNLQADIVFASAGYLNLHGHPVQEVFEVFQPHTITIDDHIYVAFVFDEKGGKKKEHYYEFNTDDAMLTTLVGLNNGPVWKNITIRLPSTGVISPVEAKYTLAELLIRDGLTPPPEMLRSRTSGRNPAPQPPVVVSAPAPTPEELSSKPDEAKSE